MMTDWTKAKAPGLDDFTRLAQAAFEALPSEVRKLAGDVIFRIEDFADDETLDEMQIQDPFELTGLYRGVDIGRRSFLGPAPEAAMIFLYRRPILDEWADRGDLELGELISHVLVHEIGHHYGLSDDDIHRIEDEA